MLWTIIVILFVLWLLGAPPSGPLHPHIYFGGGINVIWIIIIVLLILALSGRLRA